MSICGLPNDLVDDGVALLTAAGVHVVVAAGNNGIDARDISPARAPGAITVGATNVLDQRAIFSNYGPVLDIFAPGVDIMSAWIGNPKVTRVLDGTSMAAPHISGMIACFISRYGNVEPAKMAERLKRWSSKDILSNIPHGTPNRLAHLPGRSIST
ncbi:hypothetical protein E4T56_gene11328 [Termitomyces sp. T112]|nr:hypothetical protein E4T56_gene11328 [Termitomyces sp. T112]